MVRRLCVTGASGLQGADGTTWLVAERYLIVLATLASPSLSLALSLALSRRDRELKRGGENGSPDDVGKHQLFRQRLILQGLGTIKC